MLLGVNKKRTNLPASAGQAPAPRANFRQSVSGLLVATLLFSAPYSGAAADKIRAMEEAGITVCSSPAEIGEKVKSRL